MSKSVSIKEQKLIFNPSLDIYYRFDNGEIVTVDTWQKYLVECKNKLKKETQQYGTTCRAMRMEDYALKAEKEIDMLSTLRR